MKLTKKILCTCLIVITVFSFIMQNLVFADEEKQFVSVSEMVSAVSATSNSLRAIAKTKVISKISIISKGLLVLYFDITSLTLFLINIKNISP